mgnify:CR=1 FL=1
MEEKIKLLIAKYTRMHQNIKDSKSADYAENEKVRSKQRLYAQFITDLKTLLPKES